MELNGVFFDWIPLTEEQEVLIHGNKGADVGIIAQQIEKVLPEVVTTRDNGYKAVNYDKIVALLIEAIKEQQSEIDQLKDKNIKSELFISDMKTNLIGKEFNNPFSFSSEIRRALAIANLIASRD